MKKFIKIAIIALVCFVLVGCGSTEANIAKSLSGGLKKLDNAIASVGEVNTNQIIISSVNPACKNGECLPNSTYNAYNTNTTPRRNRTNYPTRLAIEDYTPSYRSRYQTRYQNANTNYSRNSLDSHIGDLEDLYGISSDVLTANNNLSSCKGEICENIDILETLCGQLKGGKIKLSSNQCGSLESLISSLLMNSSQINMTKNDVNNQVNSCKALVNQYYNNTELLSAKYVSLLNSMDTRLNYFNSALTTLKQIKNVITKNGDYQNATSNENKTTQKDKVNASNISSKTPRKNNYDRNYQTPNTTRRTSDYTNPSRNEYYYPEKTYSDYETERVTNNSTNKYYAPTEQNENNYNRDNREYNKVGQTRRIENLPYRYENNTSNINNADNNRTKKDEQNYNENTVNKNTTNSKKNYVVQTNSRPANNDYNAKYVDASQTRNEQTNNKRSSYTNGSNNTNKQTRTNERTYYNNRQISA